MCFLFQRKEIDLTSWLAFFLFVPTINTVLRQLCNVWYNIKDVQGRAGRLGAMMEAPQENMNSQASTDISVGDVVFDDVSFSYKEEREFAAIDDDIAALEEAIEDNQKAQAKAGSDYVKLQELQDQLTELEAQLEYKTERWMYLTELKEKIDAQSK